MLYFYKVGHLVLVSNEPAKNKMFYSTDDHSIVEIEFEDTAQVQSVREGDLFMPSKPR